MLNARAESNCAKSEAQVYVCTQECEGGYTIEYQWRILKEAGYGPSTPNHQQMLIL